MAERTLRPTRFPNMLVLHLKRFQFRNGRYCKLMDKVSFSLEWRDPIEGALFRLRSVVVHIGSTAGAGHYVCLSTTEGHWFLFNDEDVKMVSSTRLSQFFSGTACAYLLFYERV